MKRKSFCWLILASLFACILAGPSLLAQNTSSERILSFHSEIKICPDASLVVTETIKVLAMGREIKRGIFRDFPTRYKDRYGNNYIVDFTLIEVLRDGQPDSYHIQNLSNGQRIYIGKKDVFLSPGEYTYTLVYRTSRQLGFFADFDELYWNVTGNDWAFPIDAASATVELPAGASILTQEAYTGRMGAKGKDFSTGRDFAGNVTFAATRGLYPSEGLTIVVSWPKGFVQQPTAQIKLGYFIRDNRSLIAGLVGLAVLLGYYLSVWARFGKDPAKGTIIPLFHPPTKLSPAAVRYIMKMGFDHKVFTAEIINMAVKGYLTIEEKGGRYVLRKTNAANSALTPEELLVARLLFGSGKEIELKNENHQEINGAITNLKRVLLKSYESKYFFTNIRYFVFGLFISFLVILACAATVKSGEKSAVSFASVWLVAWSFAAVFLLRQIVSLWRGFIHAGAHKISLLGQAIGMSLFVLPFLVGEIVGLRFLTFASSISVVIVLVALVLMNILFYQLLKAPTLAGRKIMDEIEGFKMYLATAEKERLNLFHPPEKTVKLFEKYLPYALALDVEQAWAEQFSDVLAQAAQAKEEYHPSWYSGSAWSNLGAGGFASNLSSSFSSAISSSSVPPGSSSGGGGGGGGGSSGGGGGGGGGGGW